MLTMAATEPSCRVSWLTRFSIANLLACRLVSESKTGTDWQADLHTAVNESNGKFYIVNFVLTSFVTIKVTRLGGAYRTNPIYVADERGPQMGCSKGPCGL